MVFGAGAGTFFFMLLWVGGLGAVLAGMTFSSFLGTSPGPFSYGPRFPLVKGIGFSWGVGALLALLWHLGLVSDAFMEGAPLVAIPCIAVGVTMGIAGYRRRKEREFGN